jgi:hypothetical protein
LIEKTVADSCAVQKATLSLWQGIRLEGVSLRKALGPGSSMTVQIPSLRLSVRILPLLVKHVAVQEIRIRKPNISLEMPLARPSPKKDQGPALALLDLAGLPVSVSIERFSVSQGSVSFKKGKSFVLCDGLDLKLALSRSPELKGRLSLAWLEIDKKWRISNAEVPFRADLNAMEITNAKGSFCKGNMSFSGRLKTKGPTLDTLAFGLTSLSLEKVYTASGQKEGTLKGSADIRLELSQSSLAADSLRGKGFFSASRVVASGLPIQKQFWVMLFLPKLSEMRFNKVSAPMVIRNARIHTGKIEAEGDPIDVLSSGWVGIDGTLHQEVTAILAGELLTRVPMRMKTVLLPAQNNDRMLKCTVSGTFEKPVIALDEKIKARAVGQIIRTVGDGIRLFLR